MRKLVISVAAIGLLAAPPAIGIPQLYGTTAVHAQDVTITIDVFFDRLSSSGRWVRHPDYNYVWVPIDVDADWAPYTRGHWIYVDEYGWYFESDEPFAWAVYHYGRWDYDPALGWFWVPGTIWAPAWVSWRRGGDVIGWAPLRPHSHGYVVTVEIVDAEPPPGYWVFCPIDRFIAPRLELVIIERERAPVYFTSTEFVGPVIVQNNIVINTTIDIDIIREHNEVEVQKIQVVENPAEAVEASGPVAFKGKVKVEEKAAPKQVEEPAAVEAPTKGQKIAEDAAPDATGKQTEEQAGQQDDGDDPARRKKRADGEAPAPADDEAATKKDSDKTAVEEESAGPAEDNTAAEKKRQPAEREQEKKQVKKLPAQDEQPAVKKQQAGKSGRAEPEQRSSAKKPPRLEAQPQQERRAQQQQQQPPPQQQAAPPDPGAAQEAPKPQKCAPGQAKGKC